MDPLIQQLRTGAWRHRVNPTSTGSPTVSPVLPRHRALQEYILLCQTIIGYIWPISYVEPTRTPGKGFKQTCNTEKVGSKRIFSELIQYQF